MLDIKREIVVLAEWPDALVAGEPCVITEEPAGTLVRFTMRPNGAITADPSGFHILSDEGKVREARALAEMLETLDIEPRMHHVFAGNDAPVTLFAFLQAEEPRVRIADCYVGNEEHGRWLHDTGETELEQVCTALALPRVPVLYRGPWEPSVLDSLSGPVVVTPALERMDAERGRVAVRAMGTSQESV